jgi:hypothetical protein
MHVIVEVLIVLIAVWFVWRVVRTIGRFQKTPEPPDPIGTREPTPKRPKAGSGAVGVEEPDDDES